MATLQVPQSFEVESTSTHSLIQASISSSVTSAVALRGNSFQASSDVEIHEDAQSQVVSWLAVLLLILAFALIALMSGGLIFGCAPFQDALQKYGYSMEDAKTIWGQAFEIFVFGSALTSPFLDCIGPRYFATLGLILEAIGHHLLAQIASYHLEQGVMILAVACGMIGIGGNMLMLASIQFSNLFKKPCTVAAMMSGAYQFAGFIFSLLKFIPFDAFFQAYELITAVGMCLTFVCYPNEPYTSVQTPTCSWPKMLCIRQPRAAACTNCLVPLQLTRTWLFLFAFSLGSTCGAWCSGTFLQEVTLKAAKGEQEAVGTFIIWMPLVSNATFLFSPCIGMLIDSHGFIPAVQILWSTVVSSVLSLWLLPMSCQWWTLLSLNWLQTVTYSLQFTYIAQRYPSDQFGVVMAFSTIAQTVVNLLGLYLLTQPPKLAALVFILPTCIICQVWGVQKFRVFVVCFFPQGCWVRWNEDLDECWVGGRFESNPGVV